MFLKQSENKQKLIKKKLKVLQKCLSKLNIYKDWVLTDLPVTPDVLAIPIY